MSEVVQEVPAEVPAKKDKAKKDARPTASVRGMVIYADGGARPTNPGFAGSGLHGYIADTAGTIKGCGLGSIVASTMGYLAKTETESPEGRDEAWFLKRIENGQAIMVMPESYVDIIAVAGLSVTNNAAEMNGALLALEHFEQELAKCEPGRELRYLQIRSDSQYTCKGVDGWMDRWAKNNWVKPDGSSISNVPLWQKIREVYHRLKDAGIVILGDLAGKVKEVQDSAEGGAGAVPVIISARKDVRYEAVVKIMDTLQRAGIARVGLSVRTTGG
mgnify:CR=1 FL=1